MKCPLCGNDLASVIGPYKVFQAKIQDKEEDGITLVCGRCMLLTCILDILKEIKEKLNG